MSLRDFFRRIVLPCPGCGGDDAPPGGNEFCPECFRQLRVYPEAMTVCPGCGGPLDGALAICSQCLVEPDRPWRDAAAVFPYAGYGRELVQAFKFMNRPELARPLGTLAAEVVRKRDLSPDLLGPIPLTWTRLLMRGYNQAELLAKIVGARLGVPVATALKRRRGRPKQSSLNRRERHRQRGIFECVGAEKVQGRRVMIVDDVFTTGATLSAAAEALSAAGAAELTVLTVARTPAYSDLSG